MAAAAASRRRAARRERSHRVCRRSRRRGRWSRHRAAFRPVSPRSTRGRDRSRRHPASVPPVRRCRSCWIVRLCRGARRQNWNGCCAVHRKATSSGCCGARSSRAAAASRIDRYATRRPLSARSCRGYSGPRHCCCTHPTWAAAANFSSPVKQRDRRGVGGPVGDRRR